MTENKRVFLQIPQGAEGLYFEDAYRHRLINQHLYKLFNSWGYLPATTPVFDFFDIYRPMLDSETIEKIYRLIDREGDLLMLRSDITLFLAKQMGLSLKKEDLPVRICYSDTILRHQDKEDISKNEFFQTGVELIGIDGIRGDLEILMLLVKTFKLLDIPVSIHIGSRAFFLKCFKGYPEKEMQNIASAVTLRSEDKLRKILSEKHDTAKIEYLIQLFQFIGEADEFNSILKEGNKRDLLTAEEDNELQHLLDILIELKKLGVHELFRLDLSEIGIQPYYTGIVFQAYTEGMDSAVASGGRYDKLLSSFGFDSFSIGFSILLRKIEPFLSNQQRFSIPEKTEKAEGANFPEAFLKAEELRKTGKSVIL